METKDESMTLFEATAKGLFSVFDSICAGFGIGFIYVRYVEKARFTFPGGAFSKRKFGTFIVVVVAILTVKILLTASFKWSLFDKVCFLIGGHQQW